MERFEKFSFDYIYEQTGKKTHGENIRKKMPISAVFYYFLTDFITNSYERECGTNFLKFEGLMTYHLTRFTPCWCKKLATARDLIPLPTAEADPRSVPGAHIIGGRVG